MKGLCYIGLDIAKNFFQAHGADKHGKRLFNRKLTRAKVLESFSTFQPCTVGIEACSGAHYWAREIAKLGHTVRLISPRVVKPFVINNKTDAADACAICEVVSRPVTKFVAVKSEDQQILASLHRLRERLIKQRTMIVNQSRGFLSEFGIIVPVGIKHMQNAFIQNRDVEHVPYNSALQELLADMYEEFLEVDLRVTALDKRIATFAKSNEQCKRLLEIPGVGPLTATAVVAHVGDAKQYKNGRQFAASLGLTPREHSSGGKQKLLGVTKRGNSTLRRLLVQGALNICRVWTAQDAEEDRRKIWVQQVTMRRNKFIAAVAQANKTARIIWAVLAGEEGYKKDYSGNQSGCHVACNPT